MPRDDHLKLDIAIPASGDLRRDIELMKRAADLGFDGFWMAEGAHNPFLRLTVAASEIGRIPLGAITAAFPRSPMVMAQIAWDLARQTEGRFVLGLSSQERENITSSVARMREYIESLRAIWHTFQTDARLRYRGEHYQFRLMAPFFNPGPIAHPAIPLYLAGDDAEGCQLAGELAQGLYTQAFQGPSVLREIMLPALESGLKKAGRARRDIVVEASAFVIAGETDDQLRHRPQRESHGRVPEREPEVRMAGRAPHDGKGIGSSGPRPEPGFPDPPEHQRGTPRGRAGAPSRAAPESAARSGR